MNLTEMGFEQGNKYDPPNEDQVKLCIEWLKNRHSRRTVNTTYTSYHWKHSVEHWCGQYISNGAFIKACIDHGIPIRRINGSPNAHVAVSSYARKTNHVDRHVGCPNYPNCATEGCGEY
jgi:hypothetical protein